MSDASRNFHTLDGMRGVAAAVVFTLHSNWFGHYFPYGHLAVDLFFMLSGFVLESAYSRRLGSGQLGLLDFMAMRWIRLWPMFVLATLLSIIVALEAATRTAEVKETLLLIAKAAPNLLMLPTPVHPGMFVFVGVSWSIFYELVVNLLFAAFYRHLSNKVLAGVTSLALGVVAYAVKLDTLDEGFHWSTLWIGAARVFFAFPLGVLLRRGFDKLPRVWLPFPVLLAITFVALTLPLPSDHARVLKMAELVIIFPLLIHIGAHVEPSRRWFRVCTILGVASYPLYILQSGFIDGANRALELVGTNAGWHAPTSGFILFAVYMVAVILIERFYDQPVRHILSHKWKSRRSEQRL